MWNHNNFSQLCSTYGHHWNYKFTNDSWKNKCFPSASWRVLNISQTKLNTITIFHLVTQHSRSLCDNCTRSAQQQQTIRKKILMANFVRNKALDAWISPSTPAPVSPKPSAFWVSQFDCVLKQKVSKRDNTTAKFMFKIMIRKTNKPYFFNCLSALKKFKRSEERAAYFAFEWQNLQTTSWQTLVHHFWVQTKLFNNDQAFSTANTRVKHRFFSAQPFLLLKRRAYTGRNKSFKEFQKQPRKRKPVRLGRDQKRAKIIHP